MTEIKFDKRNYRKHDDKNKSLIRKSLEECGAGRSIVIDNDGEIIAGNGIYEQAQKLGLKTKIIETDGSDLVVVKRTDLNTDDEKRKQLAVMDNSTSDSSEFDLELLQVDFDEEVLESMGLEIPSVEEEKKESKYTRKVTVPIYTIKGETPSYSEMVDTTRADKLIEQIEASGFDDDFKKFLKLTATRLYEFRYDKIAEFYAHKNPKEQELMEKLALVIIDFDKAIENGYIELNNFIEECFLQENDIDD
nr:MAG TPA: ParB protein [Caudoviricetes sp.]